MVGLKGVWIVKGGGEETVQLLLINPFNGLVAGQNV